MHEEKIWFFSGPGYRLSGVLYQPELADGNGQHLLPAVVLCLGSRPVFGMFAPRYAAEFAARGYAVLTFEYRGFGDSQGPHWRHVASEQLEDIGNAVTYLLARPEIDQDRVAVWGDGSYGGAHAVMSGAQDTRVRCVVASTPFADGELLLRSTRPAWEWAEFLESVAADRRQRVLTGESTRVPPESIMHFEPASHVRARKYSAEHPLLTQLMYPLSETADSIIGYKPVEHVHKIAPRALLLIGAEKDWTIPLEHAELLYERALAPKRLVVLKDAGHNDVHNKLLPKIVAIGAEWLDIHMAPHDGDVVVTDAETAH
jgi:dipeptidyl aminopeptidase/acylaminoacyl peptidase